MSIFALVLVTLAAMYTTPVAIEDTTFALQSRREIQGFQLSNDAPMNTDINLAMKRSGNEEAKH